jgi:iron-regulated transporter 1
MQEWVDEGERGVMNSMQTTTYQLLYVIIQIMGMVFHNPAQFEVLVLFSIGAVALAVVCFAIWRVRYRTHPLMVASNRAAAAAAGSIN